MFGVDWKLRVRVFMQRLAQPTCACMILMAAPTFANVASLAHWKLALQTGVGTGVIALALSFTPLGRLFAHKYSNALVMGVLTAIADAWSHPGRMDLGHAEALLTGLVSGLLVLATSFATEDRSRRLRAAWAWVRDAAKSRPG